MTATDRLRAMLDERGVEWMDDSYAQLWCTVWHGQDGKQWRMTENRSGMLTELKSWHVTPEQAIDATLGAGTLTAEQVSNATYAHSIHADCADADWQAIADELNTTLGSGTCHMEYCDEWSGDELYPTEAYVCSACGYITEDGKPNYCPNCGRKIEVKE